MSARHEPVLLRETLEFLRNGRGLYLDATLGDGGHAAELLQREPGARLLGSDRDLRSLAFARERLAPFGDRVTFVHGTFRDLPGAHVATGGELFAGALFDFGLSSAQIDDPARGMSFMHDGPLDLRMDGSQGETLMQRLGRTDASELAGVLREHGDVSGASRAARAIVSAVHSGELRTMRQLVAVVSRVMGTSAPRTLAPLFQALRIWVNDEAADLEAALAWLPQAMRDGGVVVTIAYHSGEDRRVKHALRGERRTVSRRLPVAAEPPAGPWEEIVRKVVTPSDEEQHSNPRARSARLRAFRRKPR